METVSEDTHLEDRRLMLTRPREGGPWPGVVMLHEGYGIDDVLRRQAGRLAGDPDCRPQAWSAASVVPTTAALAVLSW